MSNNVLSLKPPLLSTFGISGERKEWIKWLSDWGHEINYRSSTVYKPLCYPMVICWIISFLPRKFLNRSTWIYDNCEWLINNEDGTFRLRIGARDLIYSLKSLCAFGYEHWSLRRFQHLKIFFRQAAAFWFLTQTFSLGILLSTYVNVD
jgi:hypothetical protein